MNNTNVQFVLSGKSGLVEVPPESLLSLVNALGEGFVVQNPAREIVLCNDAAVAISGLTASQMVDQHFLENEWKPFDEAGNLFNWGNYPAASVWRTGKPVKNVILGTQKTPSQITWINVNSYPVIHPQTGETIFVVCTFSDITAIRNAEEELRSSEKKWRSVLNNSRCGIFLLDTNYQLTLVNEYGKKLLSYMGQSPEVYQDANFLDLLPDSRREHVSNVLESVKRGARTEYEILYKKVNGSDLWLHANYAPVKNQQGEIQSICLTVNNITTLKAKEDALIRSEQRWKFALNGAGDGVWEYNFQTGQSYYSPMYKAMLGFSEEEFPNEDDQWRTRLHPDDVKMIEAIDRLYLSNEIESHNLEYRLRNKQGDYLWILDRGMLQERSADGRPLKLIGTHKNITERKIAEDLALESEQRFRSFMSNTPTMAWIIDENAVFRYLNESYMRSFNLKVDAVGKSIYEIFPADICEGFVQNNRKVWELDTSIETIEQGVGPDNQPQIYQIFKFPLAAENGVRLLGGVALDITKKIRIEQQLAAEEEKKKREIIQAIIDAQEKERRELAYELHDNVNQVLTSSKLMLEVAMEKPDLSLEFVKRSLANLNTAIVEIRKISHNLTPGTLKDISLEAAIGEVIQSINSSGKLKITYTQHSSHRKEIKQEIQLSALRICQEVLNNAIKHANANEAMVFLEISDVQVRLVIHDNGDGFDVIHTSKGIGLNNICNRAEYYNGSVKIDSGNGAGTTVTVLIPCS